MLETETLALDVALDVIIGKFPSVFANACVKRHPKCNSRLILKVLQLSYNVRWNIGGILVEDQWIVILVGYCSLTVSITCLVKLAVSGDSGWQG